MKNKKSLLFIIPAVVLVGLLCYSLIRFLIIYIPQEREKNAFIDLKNSIIETGGDTAASVADYSGNTLDEEKQSSENYGSNGTVTYNYQVLEYENPDYVGWLTVDGTVIDYPVMKSSEQDPEYYLHRDFFRNDSFSGCLFVGGGCNIDSSAFVIYGHNMNNDTMFGTLDEYAVYDYATAHPDIRFFTADGERIYRVFSAFQTKVFDDKDDSDVFKYYEETGDLSREEYDYVVKCVTDLSTVHLPNSPEYPQQILFLSTCSYHTDDGRFVVAAYRIK